MKLNFCFRCFLELLVFFSLLTFSYGCKNNELKSIFTLSPGNSIEVKGYSSSAEPITGTIYLKSNSSDNIRFRWKKVVEDSPKQWHVYFCDNVTCYLMMPDSSDLRPINNAMKQNDNRMKLYIEPNNQPGKATIKLRIFDPLNATRSDSLIYHITIE